ncbi:MAG: pyridoxamine kinase [Clostridia bacterium]|nr:pyridoxamine kinase [Clostridia bacterium]
MSDQKTVAAIHDISGMGKCSLTAAIPVLSAAGVSVSVMPTAVLSTQTGGLNDYTYRDLTDDMRPVMAHWHKIGVTFDAVYSGFLGSSAQVDIVCDFVKEFRHNGTLFLCDPAMADNGTLYDTFDSSFVEKMKKLCASADIIVPNFTEAAFLLDREYLPPPYKKEYTDDLLRSLAKEFNSKFVVLTGVDFDGKSVGAGAYDAENDIITYSLSERIDGMFHSTGDLFASSLLGGILNNFSVNDSAQKAISFTVNAIKETVKIGGDSRFGLAFERCLPMYMKSLEII